MSTIGDAFAALKRLMTMDADLQRMSASVARYEERLGNHQDRLVRIEALIEFSGFGAPSVLPPRLPPR